MAYKDREKQRATKRAYRERNREKLRAHNRAYSKANREVSRERNRVRGNRYWWRHHQQLKEKNIARRHGMSVQSLHAFITAHGGRCMGCGRTEDETGRRHHIDHEHRDHADGKIRIRGLLCHACNSVLGLVRDDPSLLRELADYLERTKS